MPPPSLWLWIVVGVLAVVAVIIAAYMVIKSRKVLAILPSSVTPQQPRFQQQHRQPSNGPRTNVGARTVPHLAAATPKVIHTTTFVSSSYTMYLTNSINSDNANVNSHSRESRDLEKPVNDPRSEADLVLRETLPEHTSPSNTARSDIKPHPLVSSTTAAALAALTTLATAADAGSGVPTTSPNIQNADPPPTDPRSISAQEEPIHNGDSSEYDQPHASFSVQSPKSLLSSPTHGASDPGESQQFGMAVGIRHEHDGFDAPDASPSNQWRVARVNSAPVAHQYAHNNTYVNKLVKEQGANVEDADDVNWWQHNLSSSSYKLTRELTQDSPLSSPGPMPRALTIRRDTKPPKLDRELTKEWVRSKQSVDLVDFLREPPEDYMVLEMPLTKEPSGPPSLSAGATAGSIGAEDADSVATFSTNTAPPEMMSARGPNDRSLRRSRPSFKIDSSIAERSIQEKEASAVWGDFSILLKSNLGLQHFMEFLRANLSAENLLFYQAVEEIRRNPTLEHVLTTFEDFVRNDASSMVNLRGTTQTRLVEEVDRVRREGRVTLEVIKYFDDAQHEIYRLMESDLFSRFITNERSDPWKHECRIAVTELHQKHREKFTLSRSVSSLLLRRTKSRSGSNL